ncbi:cytochrome b/b6 domain-containing protein [Sulfurirhabdus autotrophica]|uniref:Cytochrome b n=1 Tax=Sulfurirhabdus autotrophica TaxID=1706046 RepID=A0A4R3Y7A8_9PROT|nr:cytochrome b/b6 domain-containing protein [Sulfurirhabdus autotrophica]TCV86414.1 cytochrome b [Sulfurirhabdus autotrophica]
MQQENQTNPNIQTIKIWDLPTRLFHWSLVILLGVSWASIELSDNAFNIHEYSGYTILSLVIFRVLWGIFGSTTSRFRTFIRGLQPTIAYAKTLLQSKPGNQIGHNPLGGWMVLLMLGFLLFQAVTGLFSNDDVSSEGPLAHWISKDISDILSGLHHESFDILLVIVGLHIAAVLFYRFFKRDNLITPLITGFKPLAGETPPKLRFTSNWIALLLFGIVIAGVALLVTKA